MFGSTHDTDRPDGFTLIELLIVIVVLGILATVVVASVSGIVDRGEEATCEDDRRILATAAESYFAQVGGSVIPATGADADRYERTLMNQGLVREPSDLYDLDDGGQLVLPASSRCASL
jgi:prepilin-type N-terminal cleavage/methylation domain-containing protein